MAFLLDRGMQRENSLAVIEDYRFLHKGWPLEKCWGKGERGDFKRFFCHCKVEIFFSLLVYVFFLARIRRNIFFY